MYNIVLSEKELNNIIQAEKRHKTRDIKRRFRTIRLKSQGMKSKDICERLEVSPHAVTKRVKTYLAGGINALQETKYHTRRRSRLDEIESEIKMFIQENKVHSIKEIQSFIYAQTGKNYDISRLWKRVKKKKIFAHQKTLF